MKRSKESGLVSISVFKINSEIQSIGDLAKLFVNVRSGWLAALQDDISPMSAFPKSGRSDRQELGKTRVRFLPEAAFDLVELFAR